MDGLKTILKECDWIAWSFVRVQCIHPFEDYTSLKYENGLQRLVSGAQKSFPNILRVVGYGREWLTR